MIIAQKWALITFPFPPLAAGSGGIIRRDLTRKTQFIRKSFRDEYLEDLVESGELVVKSGAKGGEVYFSGS